jgi:hypothetical protein
MTEARKRTRSSAKKAGATFERVVADYLANTVDDRIDRRVRTGARDCGDIAGLRAHGQHVAIECKNTRAWTPGEWLREAEKERVNDSALAGVVVAKRHGSADPGEQVVLMTLADFAALLTGVRPVYRIEEGSLMPWFMTDDKFHSHKKVVRATAAGVAPIGLWNLAGSWSSDQLTDGFIPEYIAMRLDPHGWEENAAALVKAGLWVVDQFDDEPGWRFHEWDQRNPTRVKVEAKREAARERMERVRSSRKDGSQDVRANNQRTDSEPAEHFARTSRDVRLTPTQPSPTQPTTSLSEAPPRDDVERVCEYLADWVVKNGSKRPTVTKKWRDAARLMLDRDGRTEEQVHKAIDWCQNDEFWRKNIMSMPKLREQFDRLRLAAQAKPSNVVAIRGGTGFEAKHAMLAESRRRMAELDALDELEGPA